MDRKDPITKAIYQLEKALQANDVVFALRICTALKRTGAKPTGQIYRLLMEVFARKGMYLEIVAAFDDALSMGVEPDKEMWNCLLQVYLFQGSHSESNVCRHAPTASSHYLKLQTRCSMLDTS
jgi:pentatricopeptide repeat protein